MEKGYLGILEKLLSKPIIPVVPEKEYFEETVAFPDKDATEEEIAEYLKKDINYE